MGNALRLPGSTVAAARRWTDEQRDVVFDAANPVAVPSGAPEPVPLIVPPPRPVIIRAFSCEVLTDFAIDTGAPTTINIGLRRAGAAGGGAGTNNVQNYFEIARAWPGFVAGVIVGMVGEDAAVSPIFVGVGSGGGFVYPTAWCDAGTLVGSFRVRWQQIETDWS